MNDLKRYKELSHSLSWILRHNALDLGLNMTTDGYVQVEEILTCKHPRFKSKRWNIDDIRYVVETCAKQRYKLEMVPAVNFTCTRAIPDKVTNSSSNDELILCIRANQGHSIAIIKSDLLLKELSAEDLMALPMIVHGTNKIAWDNFIKTQGLSRMKRNHIHFATGLPDNGQVISGMRQNCDIHIHIDRQKCISHNVKFFRSENGVILCAGTNNEGVLSSSFFSYVTDGKGEVIFRCS